MGRISTLIVIVLSAALLWSCSKSGKTPSHEAACKHIIPIICDSAPTPAEKTQCKTEFTEKLAEFTADCAQEIKSKNISPSCIMKAKTMADLEGCEAQAKTKGKKDFGGGYVERFVRLKRGGSLIEIKWEGYKETTDETRKHMMKQLGKKAFKLFYDDMKSRKNV